MNRYPQECKAIASTRNTVIGLVLQGGLTLYFADKGIGHALRDQWELMATNAIAFLITAHWTFHLATRIAEKLEK